MDGGTKSWPRVYMGSSGVMPAVSPKSYSKRPSVRVGHDEGSTARRSTPASGTNGQRDPAEVRPATARPDDDVGSLLAGQGQLLLGLEPDDRLVQQHVVEHRSQRVVRVVATDRVAHGVADGRAERARGGRDRRRARARPSPPHTSIITRR